MVVNNVEYSRDLIITPDSIIDNWWRKESHMLYLQDIEEALNLSKPDVLVAGTGKFGLMKIDESLIKFLDNKNIEFHALPSAKAAKLFNRLTQDGKRVTGAFHITC